MTLTFPEGYKLNRKQYCCVHFLAQFSATQDRIEVIWNWTNLISDPDEGHMFSHGKYVTLPTAQQNGSAGVFSDVDDPMSLKFAVIVITQFCLLTPVLVTLAFKLSIKITEAWTKKDRLEHSHMHAPPPPPPPPLLPCARMTFRFDEVHTHFICHD